MPMTAVVSRQPTQRARLPDAHDDTSARCNQFSCGVCAPLEGGLASRCMTGAIRSESCNEMIRGGRHSTVIVGYRGRLDDEPIISMNTGAVARRDAAHRAGPQLALLLPQQTEGVRGRRSRRGRVRQSDRRRRSLHRPIHPLVIAWPQSRSRVCEAIAKQGLYPKHTLKRDSGHFPPRRPRGEARGLSWRGPGRCGGLSWRGPGFLGNGSGQRRDMA